jgi:hypothetical protein
MTAESSTTSIREPISIHLWSWSPWKGLSDLIGKSAAMV